MSEKRKVGDGRRTGFSSSRHRTAQKQDSQQRVTFASIALTGLLAIVMYMVLTIYGGDTSPVYIGAFIAVLYAAACALIIVFTGNGAEIRRFGTVQTEASEVLKKHMNEAIFEVVNSVQSPMFICLEDGSIEWSNNAVSQLGISVDQLYGMSVKDIFGVELGSIADDKSQKGIKLSANGKIYFAKCIDFVEGETVFRLIVTEDGTETEALNTRIQNEETVIAYIIIDNFAEMMQYDNDMYRPAAAKIDAELRQWAADNGGILKEYERDKYIFITDMQNLDELIVERFGILDRVRRAWSDSSSIPMTISMGVSGISGSFEEKERAARDALDMALQRGGDQAVVKGDGTLEFFGGVTKSVQKRTNVASRMNSSKLISAMRSASNVIIMGHRYADFDAFGSSVGLARLAMYCGVRVNIVINMADNNLMGCRGILAPMEEYLGLFIDAERGLDLLETGTLVVVSDVNNLRIAEEPELAYRANKLAIIDHHRKTAEFDRDIEVEYIEPSASSASELVSEMLEQVLPKDDLTAAEANLLLAGITLDTKQFSKNTGTRTFSASMYLRDRGADPGIVSSLFREKFEDYRLEAMFRSNVEIYRGKYAISVVNDIDGADRTIAAKAADNLLKVDGIEASFAAMRTGSTFNISARSAGKVNVQLIMEQLGGGGHFDGAAAQIKERTEEEIISSLKQAIDAHT